METSEFPNINFYMQHLHGLIWHICCLTFMPTCRRLVPNSSILYQQFHANWRWKETYFQRFISTLLLIKSQGNSIVLFYILILLKWKGNCHKMLVRKQASSLRPFHTNLPKFLPVQRVILSVQWLIIIRFLY